MHNRTIIAPELRTIALEEWPVYVCGICLSFILASIALSGWPDGLVPNVDYPYLYAGDALSHSALIQRVMEGWVFDNNRNGYPFGSSALDYPMSDAGNLALLKLLGAMSGSFVGAFNWFILLSFPLSFVTAYFALRSFGTVPPLAISGALIFAFVPFRLLRIAHLFYLSSFVVPVFFAVAFFFFAHREQSVLSRSSIYTFGGLMLLLVCLASFGVYYALFGLIVLLIVAAMVGLNTGAAWRMAPLFGAASAVCIGVIVNIAPNLMHEMARGENNEVAERSPAEAEIYGLKAIQLIMPRAGHRLESWRIINDQYSNSAPLINENRTASLGLIGSIGLVIVGTIVFGSLSGLKYNDQLVTLAAIVAVLFMFATIGGLGSFFASAVSPMIRAWNRASIFIGFGTIVVFLIVFQTLVSQFVPQAFHRIAIGVGAIFISIIGLLDQTVPADTAANEATRREFELDKSFVETIEKSLPEGTAVYQLPYMGFPEVPNLPSGLASYNLLTGFLHSKSLKWSHGGMKGRNGDLFFRQLSQEPLAKRIDVIRELGFGGIYVDLRGFQDGGEEIVDELTALLGGGPSIAREDGKIVFFELPTVSAAKLPDLDGEQLALWAGQKFNVGCITIGLDAASNSHLLSFTDWYDAEPNLRWTQGNNCHLRFRVAGDTSQAQSLILRGWSLGPQRLALYLNDKEIFSGQLEGHEQDLAVQLPRGLLESGENTLSFVLPDARRPDNGDTRTLGFALKTLRIQ